MPQFSDRFLALITVLGLAAASVGGFAAYITRPLLAYAARAEHSVTFGAERQISGAVRSDRLAPSRVSPLHGNFSPSLSLPYVTPDRDVDSTMDAPADTMTPLAGAERVIAIPLPPRRPKDLPAVSSGLLNDAQITGIKSRLGLTPEQAQHWPAVESALRDVARRHLQGLGTHQNGAAPRIEVNSPEVQRLIKASVPLIRQLREDQKREVRELVRMVGLGAVASQI